VEDVVSEEFDGVRSRRNRRLAVATSVVSEKAKMGGEIGELRTPRRKICPERVGENENGSGFRTGEGVVDADVAEVGEGHGSTFGRKLLKLA
jgi:hypothetical protein